MKLVKHIFLIDDDNMINMITTNIIKIGKLAKKISSETNAKEALDQLMHLWLTDRPAFPDFIFLDIDMPDMDGWEFLDMFKEFPPEAVSATTIVMLTSSIDLFDIRKSKTYSMVKDYVSKPIQIPILERLFSSKHIYFGVSQEVINKI